MGNYPKKLYYMIDILCNEKCSKCSHWKHASQKGVSNIKKVSKFVEDSSSIDELVIVGGEPLIYKDEIMELIINLPNNVRTTIITNGVFADKDFIDFIKDKNVHCIFSIDTLDIDFWFFVRGNNTFNKVISNFEYAALNLKPNQISIQSVLSKETMEHVKVVSEWCEEKGVYHSIQDYVQEGFDGYWTELNKYKKVKNEYCYAYLTNMSILPNGDIFTCFQQNLIPGCSKPLGNINSNSYKEIISQSYLFDVLNAMKSCKLPCRVLKCNIEGCDFSG